MDLLCICMCALCTEREITRRAHLVSSVRMNTFECVCVCVCLCACVNSWQACLRCCVNRNEGILAEVTRWVGGVLQAWMRHLVLTVKNTLYRMSTAAAAAAGNAGSLEPPSWGCVPFLSILIPIPILLTDTNTHRYFFWYYSLKVFSFAFSTSFIATWIILTFIYIYKFEKSAQY